MQREREYKHLADNIRKRGGEEQNAQLRAQWEILAATYVQLADQSKKIDDAGTHYDPLDRSREAATEAASFIINLSSRTAGLPERASLCLLRSRALVNRLFYQ